MENIAHPDLLAEIAKFCDRTGLSVAAFGKEAMGDPRFVYDLKAGRQCLPRTVEKARAYIAANAERAA
jgi:hypothetical protein